MKIKLETIALIIGLVISVVSISISLLVYFKTVEEGSLNIFIPSRYGTLAGEHHHNKSDKLLMCFTIHNNGNLFRNIKSFNLELKDKSGNKWNLKAIGKFDEVKNLNLQEGSLTTNPNYSIISAVSLDKNQFTSLNLLFFYEKDSGWIGGNKKFELKKGEYIGKLILNSLENKKSDYELCEYESSLFQFDVKYDPRNHLNTIDTFIDTKLLTKNNLTKKCS